MSMVLAIVPKPVMGIGFLIVLVALLGCVTPKGDGNMQVEVDVYSGRPNPHWELTLQEAEELISRFRGLPQYQGVRRVNEGLGYRGLIVTKPSALIEGYQEILISNGLVVARKNGQSQQFTDQNRNLEKWVLQTGKGRLDQPLYEYINSQFP